MRPPGFTKTLILFCIATMTFACGAGGQADIDEIGVEEFKKMSQNSNCILLDVRTPEEIAEGKIPDAVEMDFHDEAFEQKLDSLDRSKTYLVYCRTGRRSSKAARVMTKSGFEKVYNLKGGYTAWQQNDEE